MNDKELEAVNYTIGNLQIAGLFARLVDMQTEVDVLTNERDDLKTRVISLNSDLDSLSDNNQALTCEVEDLKAHIARLEHDGLC